MVEKVTIINDDGKEKQVFALIGVEGAKTDFGAISPV